jgi:hypothetical protein
MSGALPLNARIQQSPTDTILRYGARVSYVLKGETERRTAVIGKIGECFVILSRVVNTQSWSRARLNSVSHLEVSSIYNGTPGPDGAPRIYMEGNDLAGEKWIPLDLAVIRRRYGTCPES